MTNWNEGQLRILESISRDHNILVSAAAGSGKTAVLVERIVDSVEQGLCGIDEILVVTFTRAAASQMRGKITRLLEERAYNSGDPRMLRQLSLSANADISTIDSFCNRVVRENFQLAGVDPGFDLFDAGEGALLSEDVLDDVLDRLYREPEFAAFAKAFIRRSYDDSRLRELILRVYRVSEGFADPEDWIERNTIRKDQSPEEILQMPWAVAYFGELQREAEAASKYVEAEIRRYEAEADPKKQPVAEKILKILDEDLEFYDRIRDAETLTEATKALEVDASRFMKASYVKVYDPEEIEILAKTRKDQRDKLKKALEIFAGDDMEAELAGHAALEEHLIRAVRMFRDALLQEKRRRKKYEYGDIAHFAYRVLYDPNKQEVTAVGRRYAEKYRYIYIDEYQDGSDMQEHILNSVARQKDGMPSNIFMVGDVKQSIYRFRQARPQLFLEKEEQYGKGTAPGEVLYLNRNYRSRTEILDATNFVFRQVMRREFGGIVYDENVQLNPPENREEPELRLLPECLLVDPVVDETDGDGQPVTVPPVADDVLEAGLIGRKILALVSDGKARFGDIVILQRSVAGSGAMLREYERLGIPVQLEDPKAYFDAEEVVVILSVLQLIDNARQDIPYAAVLRSPIGGCSDAELAYLAMHRSDRAEALYDTAELFLEGEAEAPEELSSLDDALREKVTRLHSCISRWKRESLYLSIAQLLERILEDTGFREVAARMPRGNRRLNNLMQLRFKAEEFEQAGNHGLFYFLRYIEKCKIHELEFGEMGNLSESSDAVRICTIHSSKGLEYPVVFVARLGKQFNRMDQRKMITVSADFGVAPNRIRKIGGKYWLSEKGMLRDAVNRLENLADLHEELRLLYVAMTRAKERLYLTGVRKGLLEDLRNGGIPSEITYPMLTGATTYLDFLVPVIMKDRSETEKYMEVQVLSAEQLESAPVPVIVKEETETKERPSDAGRIEALAEELKSRHAFIYPYQAAVLTRTKLSVSEIKHAAMEEQLPPADQKETGVPGSSETVPKQEDGSETAKPGSGITGAEYGTAVHKLMELLPFEEIDSRKEMHDALKNLLQGPHFTEDLRKAIRIDKIEQFYSEEQESLFQRMKRAAEGGRLYREQQFLIGLPASRLGQEIPVREAAEADARPVRVEEGTALTLATEEPVVLQGVIDAFFLEKDEAGNTFVVLMDYKTDRVDSPEELIGRYRAQLSLYEKTLTDILQLPVREVWIYGFGAGIGEVRL